MANYVRRERIVNAMIRSLATGIVCSGAVFFSALAFEHQMTLRTNGATVRDRVFYYGFVHDWIMPAAFMAGAGTSALFDVVKLAKRRYTLAEVKQLALEQGTSPEAIASLILIEEDKQDAI